MKIIAGNWKMNGTQENLVKMIQDLSAIDTENAIILCVPYTMLCTDSGKIALASQDISAHDHGAYTGEISLDMLADFNVKFVIIGHSERRQMFNESDEFINQKAIAILNSFAPNIEYNFSNLSLNVTAHAGPGTIGLGLVKKYK